MAIADALRLTRGVGNLFRTLPKGGVRTSRHAGLPVAVLCCAMLAHGGLLGVLHPVTRRTVTLSHRHPACIAEILSYVPSPLVVK